MGALIQARVFKIGTAKSGIIQMLNSILLEYAPCACAWRADWTLETTRRRKAPDRVAE
jgi:hypothetical protein